MKKAIFLVFLFTGWLLISCKNSSSPKNQAKGTITRVENVSSSDSGIVYQSGNLIIQRISNHVYQHISFLTTKDFGRVGCNGMVVVNDKEAIVFDTPADDEGSGELINYLSKTLNHKIIGIIPTHFHEDCVGGLEKFNENSIPSYAYNKTIALLNNKGRVFSKPLHGFDDSLVLNIGDKNVYISYFGEGHTKDNVIGYFPEDKAVFGGCLIKEVGAGKGNLEDANITVWSETVRRIKQRYPETKTVIPGHGKSGGTELFDYTIKLFE